MQDREHGVVQWWDSRAGKGMISSDDGRLLWAYFTDVRGTKVLYEGQRVSYVPYSEMLASALRATRIRVDQA